VSPSTYLATSSCSAWSVWQASFVRWPTLLADWREGDELVVVDNASNDGTVDFLRELGQKHPSLILIFNEARGRVSGITSGDKANFPTEPITRVAIRGHIDQQLRLDLL
jgi:hypothetical protein